MCGDRIGYKVKTEGGVLFCTSEETGVEIVEGAVVEVRFDRIGPVLLSV